ncbi:hypothetical protein [Mesorhizobium huakuii]|uniref:Uncharacterized protein n=1 Tax=Mesorhizobium huakuii TaxID=28104 RepID=A0A7G6T0U1_9HYPH|nr:hypothetical protein [Mesorhizobium huakuii]QND60373.1 hypothetical protein HB778_30375 [Mesorhizobium huakuii]
MARDTHTEAELSMLTDDEREGLLDDDVVDEGADEEIDDELVANDAATAAAPSSRNVPTRGSPPATIRTPRMRWPHASRSPPTPKKRPRRLQPRMLPRHRRLWTPPARPQWLRRPLRP